jgi:hypothetical protein
MNEVDHLSRPGAERLAARLRSYWAEQGCKVTTRLEEVSGGKGSAWSVRSDMIGGFPSVTVTESETTA